MINSPSAQKYMSEIIAHRTAAKDKPLDSFFWWNMRCYHASDDGSQKDDLKYVVFSNSDQRAAQSGEEIEIDGRFYKPGETYKLANLVLQGGGTLGLAHAGFIAGLELAGVRFPGIAGTSAGSIIAMGMIAIRDGDITKATTDELIDLVSTVPMDEFLDGPRPIRGLIKRFLLGRTILHPQYWPSIRGSLKRILYRRGLNYGSTFESWLQFILADRYGLKTLEELDDALSQVAIQLFDAGKDLNGSNPFRQKTSDENAKEFHHLEANSLLKIYATAMPVGVKFEFPEYMKYLGDLYRTNSPASLVRMSMSIPLFFEPVVRKIEGKNWKGETGFVKEYLERVTPDRLVADYLDLDELAFLDGGLFSNLPTDAFHGCMKDIPTISVPLVSDSKSRITRRKSLNGLGEDVMAVASAVRLQRDRDAINRRNKDADSWNTQQDRLSKRRSDDTAKPRQAFPVHITKIDTAGANWLNFVMSDDEKSELFEAGLKRAHDFILSGS